MVSGLIDLFSRFSCSVFEVWSYCFCSIRSVFAQVLL